MIETKIQLKDLVAALKNSEFVYYYQPKVSMVTGELSGAEALIRWKKPDGTIIPPCEFIPLAESSGFINEITLSMFQQLIVDMSIIHDLNDSLVISFNASAKDFVNNKLTEVIRNSITNKLIVPDRLEVELTETAILKTKGVEVYLRQLENIGVHIAMDDFGTGFSSIDMLSQLPFSCVKIDQGVVSRMEDSDKDFSIVESSIRMVHDLDLTVVAEGIETERTYKILVDMGCSVGQGYWMSRPLPLHEFINLVVLKRQWPTSTRGLLCMAQLDHMKWRKAIIDGASFLISRKGKNTALRGAPELDSSACRLGKWYYGQGRKFSGTKHYDALEEPHRCLYQAGMELLEYAKSGASKKELILYMRKVSEQSIIVINLLHELEKELFLIDDFD